MASKRYTGTSKRITPKGPPKTWRHGQVHPHAPHLTWCENHQQFEPRADLPIDQGNLRRREEEE